MSGAILRSSSSEPALVSATTDRGTVAELTHLGHDSGAESRHSCAGASKTPPHGLRASRSPGVRLQPPKEPDAPSPLPRCEARIILAVIPRVRQRHPPAPDPLRSVIIRILIIAIVALFLVMWVRAVIDVWRRTDLSSSAKAAWAIIMLILPFIGLLVYTMFRPTESQVSRR